MLKWVVLMWMGFSLCAQAQLVEYAPDTSPFLQQAVAQALVKLPADYLKSVKGKISIAMKPFPNDRHIRPEVLCDLSVLKELDIKGSVLGQVRRTRNGHQLTISSRLVELAQQGVDLSCSHGSFEQTLQATIIHELTHVKDNFEKLSQQADFKRIVGTRRDLLGRQKIISHNQHVSPDSFEFKNLEEALATNVEYLVLDPEFECRKPATARYLSRQLGIGLKGQCRRNYRVMTQSAYLEDNYQHTVSFHPSRIYQVHYLFAGKGQALMSRWGHAMFRLVVCAPHRKTVGPDCLKDVSHHVALTYRAYVTDMNIDYWKGMRGSYPSQLFIMRFHEIQQEYTKFELRDLYSIPLKMTRQQQNDFIDLALERYWTYQGKYYFLDNNCGTETQKHLAVALDDEQSKLIRSITPLRLFQDIIKSENELTVEPVTGLKRQQLIDQGLLIPNMFNEYNETYQYLRQVGIFQEKNFKRFMQHYPAHVRSRIYQKYFTENIPTAESSRLLVLKLIHLERYLAAKYVQNLPRLALEKIKNNKNLLAEIEKMGDSMQLLTTQPWEIIDAQYGAPLADEFDHSYPAFLQQRRDAIQASAENQVSDLQQLLDRPVFLRELRELEWLKHLKTQTNNLFLIVMGLKPEGNK